MGTKQNSDPSEPTETLASTSRNPSYSHAGPIHDLGLSGIRDQIKNVMIPLLIKVFQLKLEIGQSHSLPSRLTHSKAKESLAESEAHLKRLDEDLKLLSLWCQSSRNQISKALSPPEENSKASLKQSKSGEGSTNPAVTKSFSDAVSSQSHKIKKQLEESEKPTRSAATESPVKSASSILSWLRKTFRSNQK